MKVDIDFSQNYNGENGFCVRKNRREKNAKMVSVLLMIPEVYGNSVALRPRRT